MTWGFLKKGEFWGVIVGLLGIGVAVWQLRRHSLRLFLYVVRSFRAGDLRNKLQIPLNRIFQRLRHCIEQERATIRDFLAEYKRYLGDMSVAASRLKEVRDSEDYRSKFNEYIAKATAFVAFVTVG